MGVLLHQPVKGIGFFEPVRSLLGRLGSSGHGGPARARQAFNRSSICCQVYMVKSCVRGIA